MGMRRGSLPVDDTIDADERSNLLVDKIQYVLPFRGRRWPVDSDVGQCLVQQPPAMGFVIQLRHHLPGVHRMRCDAGRVNVVGMDIFPVIESGFARRTGTSGCSG